MTNAQQEVRTEQDLKDLRYERRAFRKECVAQGIVKFVREDGHVFYIMKYRGIFVCTIFHDKNEELKMCAVWNTIKIAEKTIKKIEGVKHESN